MGTSPARDVAGLAALGTEPPSVTGRILALRLSAIRECSGCARRMFGFLGKYSTAARPIGGVPHRLDHLLDPVHFT